MPSSEVIIVISNLSEICQHVTMNQHWSFCNALSNASVPLLDQKKKKKKKVLTLKWGQYFQTEEFQCKNKFQVYQLRIVHEWTQQVLLFIDFKATHIHTHTRTHACTCTHTHTLSLYIHTHTHTLSLYIHTHKHTHSFFNINVCVVPFVAEKMTLRCQNF